MSTCPGADTSFVERFDGEWHIWSKQGVFVSVIKQTLSSFRPVSTNRTIHCEHVNHESHFTMFVLLNVEFPSFQSLEPTQTSKSMFAIPPLKVPSVSVYQTSLWCFRCFLSSGSVDGSRRRRRPSGLRPNQGSALSLSSLPMCRRLKELSVHSTQHQIKVKVNGRGTDSILTENVETHSLNFKTSSTSECPCTRSIESHISERDSGGCHSARSEHWNIQEVEGHPENRGWSASSSPSYMRSGESSLHVQISLNLPH